VRARSGSAAVERAWNEEREQVRAVEFVELYSRLNVSRAEHDWVQRVYDSIEKWRAYQYVNMMNSANSRKNPVFSRLCLSFCLSAVKNDREREKHRHEALFDVSMNVSSTKDTAANTAYCLLLLYHLHEQEKDNGITLCL